MYDDVRIEELDNGNYSILKYNSKYDMWIQIECVKTEEDLEYFITNTLAKQFIRNF